MSIVAENTSLTFAEMLSPDRSGLQVLAVGPWQQREFRIVRRQIDPEKNWPTSDSLEQALAEVDEQTVAPEIVLLAQPRPGYYSQSLLDRFQATAPLTRVIVVAGSWCEGELRTGKPLDGVQRFYWYEFAAWWRHAIALWAAGESPPWSLPTGDARTRSFVCDTGAAGLVEIDSQDHETFAALSAAISPYGWSAIWQPRGRHRATAVGTSVGIWDGGQFDPPEVEHLAEFCRRMRGQDAPVVALLDFPREEHFHQATEIGAHAVLAKPYFVDDLLWAIGHKKKNSHG